MKKILIHLFVITAFFACKKTDSMSTNPTNPTAKVAPDGFNYNTTKMVSIDITLLSNNNQAIKGVPVSFYAYDGKDLGNKVLTAMSNQQGKVIARVALPAYIDTLVIDPNYLGLVRNSKAFISNGTITATIGGGSGFSGNIVGTFTEEMPIITPKDVVATHDINGVKTNTVFRYMGTTNLLGRPNYLETQRDVISAGLLASINNSLPEGSKVPIARPSYLSNNATSNLNIVELSDVWITFVHEGAGYKNALGFYKYPTNRPPSSLADIDTITFIYPNTSFTGSGGNLVSGDKVKIGRFEAGTTIGIVLYQNAYINNATSNNVNTSATAFFSDAHLNPESSASLRKHSVLLTYENYLLVGFEDIDRSLSSCDQDFNDAIYFASSNPVEGISKEGVKPVDEPVDTDGDGVNDPLDEFPTDPTKAYINYFPNVNQWGTLAFEDQWPNVGDYDMNDLVVSYRYKMISNASNNVVEMTGEFAPIAVGASYQNGFGVEFPFSSSIVQTVTGQRHTNGYITRAANGTEAGHSKAVIIPFDNARSLISNPDGTPIVNTDMNKSKMVGDTSKVVIVFTSPVNAATLGDAPFNPFLISNLRRGYEVHLPNYTPTALATSSLFGTEFDNSNISSGRYYVTTQNYPWAIHFAEPFSYPIERAPINEAYLRFFDWTGSGGNQYKDWYKNTGSGYRNTSKIYSK